MALAYVPSGSALSRTSAASRRSLVSRRSAGALIIAAALHAAVGVALWEAKYQPRYEPAPAQAVQARLVRPPPSPPPPPPKQPPKREVHRTPSHVAVRRAAPRPTLRPRPAPMLTDVAPPPVLPLAPAAPAAAPSPPVLAAPAPVPAPKPPERIPVITNPDWLRMPNADDLARYYPEHAEQLGIAGQATINCAVDAGGRLVGCRVAAESPRDDGFGDAAIKMAGEFQMRPMTRDGIPVAGARIRIAIRFALPDA